MTERRVFIEDDSSSPCWRHRMEELGDETRCLTCLDLDEPDVYYGPNEGEW